MKETPKYIVVTRIHPDKRAMFDADLIAVKDGDSFRLIKSRETESGKNVPTEEMLEIVEDLVTK